MKIQDWNKFFIFTVFAWALASCSSPTPKSVTGDGSNTGIDETGDVVASTHEGNMAAEGVPESKRINTSDGVEYGKWENIHFDYDSATIKSEDRRVLENIAKWMKENPSKKIMIAGHCDERGTLEYNRALGQRRASAARAYITGLGVPAGNIGTVSWGEERPLDLNHNDEAWAKNRRDEIGIVK